jgi:cytochrome c553
MKRVLLALALFAPLAVLATESAKDPLVKGDAAAGETKAAACVACHGPVGNSAAPTFPKLAGQSSKYIYEQLTAFKSGKRNNPIMMPQAATLSDQDMRDLAAYFATQKPAPGVASKESVAIAEKIYRAGIPAKGVPACAACHGPTGAGSTPSGFPRIGGQQATYTSGALQRLRSGYAESLPEGNVKTMASIASKLSDQEIEALASYVNGLQ